MRLEQDMQALKVQMDMREKEEAKKGAVPQDCVSEDEGKVRERLLQEYEEKRREFELLQKEEKVCAYLCARCDMCNVFIEF